MNEKETHILPEQIPVEEFQPIDIFQQPPMQRKLSVKGLPGRVWKKTAQPKPGAAVEDSPYVTPVRRSPQAYQLQETQPQKEQSPLTEADSANAMYLHAIAGLVISGMLFSWLGALIPQAVPWPQRAAALLFHGLILAFPVICKAVQNDDAAEKMRFRPAAGGALWLCFMCGLGASLFGIGTTQLWGRALSGWGANLAGSTQVEWRHIPAVLIGSVMLPAVCEEIFFRGYLLAAWEERRGWLCVPVCAVLFMLLHGSLAGWPGQLAMGVLLGMICIRGGSVLCAILAHLGYNLGVVVLSAVWQSSGWLQEAGVAVCGVALAGVFYLLMCSVSGRKTISLPTHRSTSWEGAAAMYAAVITVLVRYLLDGMRLFGGV